MVLLLLRAACILIAVVRIAPVSQAETLNVTGPESVNASIGSKVEFECCFQNVPSGVNVFTKFVQWNINNSNIEFVSESIDHSVLQNDYPDNNSIVGKLTLNLFKSQDIMWNNSQIACIVHIIQAPTSINISSPSVLLRIQGTLDQPPNLTVELSKNNNSLIIRWNLPYTLTHVEISNFLINVSSYSISDYSSLSQAGTFFSEDMTSFVYNIPVRCAVYNVSVQAVTLAGLGEPSYGDQAIFERAPKKLTTDDVIINIAYVQQNLSVTFTFTDSNCEAEQADMVGVVIYNGSDVVYCREKVELIHLTNSQRDFTVTLPSTVKHLRASAMIILTNSAENRSTESMLIILNLFDVQGLNLSPIACGVEVKCVFAKGTDNENCKVTISCDDCDSEAGGFEIELSYQTRVANFSTSKLPCDSSVYCFLVFDVCNSMKTCTSTPALGKSNVTVTKAGPCPGMDTVITSETPTITGYPVSDGPLNIVIIIVCSVFVVVIVICIISAILIWLYKTFVSKKER